MEWTKTGKKLRDYDNQFFTKLDLLNFKNFNLYPIYRSRLAYQIFNSSNNIIYNDKVQLLDDEDFDMRSLNPSIISNLKDFISENTILRIANPQIDTKNIDNKSCSNLVNNIKINNLKYKSIYVNPDKKYTKLNLGQDYHYFNFSIKRRFIFCLNLIKDIPHIISFMLRSFKISKSFNISFKSTIGGFVKFYNSYGKFKAIYKDFRKFDICFMFASYGNEGEIMALKEIGIKVSEYQHGVLYSEHFGYNYDAIVKPYKEKFPIPHKLFTYDKWTKSNLLRNNFYHDNDIKVVGNFKLLTKQKKISVDPKSLCLCIFSQKDYFNIINKSSDLFSKLLLNLDIKSDSVSSIKIRLHPREKEIPKMITKKFPFAKVTHEPFGDLINEADLIITCSPSVFYEAVSIKKSVIFQQFKVSLNGTKLLKNKTQNGTFIYLSK
tara:strand:+ start:168 stop:1472 length:1305 start_codon:yes stop_codon:yes gene_type:complete